MTTTRVKVSGTGQRHPQHGAYAELVLAAKRVLGSKLLVSPGVHRRTREMHEDLLRALRKVEGAE